MTNLQTKKHKRNTLIKAMILLFVLVFLVAGVALASSIFLNQNAQPALSNENTRSFPYEEVLK